MCRATIRYAAACGLLLASSRVSVGAPAAADEPAGPAPGDAAALRRVAEAYLKNRAAIDPFQCEFTFAKGRAATLDEAVKKGPTKNRLTAECSWVIAGPNICYRRRIDIESIEALRRSLANPKAGKNNAILAEIQLDELHLLTDGKRMLRYDPDFVANLMGPNRIAELIESLTPTTTPWALGGMGQTIGSNPGRWILEKKLGTWRYVGPKRMDGRNLVAVECRRSGYQTTYYFDPKQGYLPVRRELQRDSGAKALYLITAAERLSRGRWFPKRVVRIDTRAGETAPRVQEIVVTFVDGDYKAQPKDFAVDLRARSKLNHVDNLLSEFRLDADTRVGLKDLEKLDQRCQIKVEERLEERRKRGR